MKIEVRADGVHISGYVNVTEKQSRPVITPHGKVIEVIEPRAFEKAIARAGDISVTVDHDSTHIYASTREGNLKMYEDNIGLHADVLIVDPAIIEIAKQGKIKGWSFGMYNVVDTLEQRADQLPLRRISDMDIDHITLVVKKNPVYSATSVEVRAENEIDLELRAMDITPQITQTAEDNPPPASFDIKAYKERADKLRK
ncbi:MAG: HK97 family phage prohead protease [Oscillospiraceae bacterium]|nr:HK97 family phage prohead protease [Oscillospiraceae bacterium]